MNKSKSLLIALLALFAIRGQAQTSRPTFKGFYIGEPLTEFVSKTGSQQYVDTCRAVFVNPKLAKKAHVWQTDCLRLVNALDRGTPYMVSIDSVYPPPRPQFSFQESEVPTHDYVEFQGAKVVKITFSASEAPSALIDAMTERLGTQPSADRTFTNENGFGQPGTRVMRCGNQPRATSPLR